MAAAPAAVWILAAAAAAGYALAELVKQFGAAYNGVSSDAVRAKGYIAQTADAINAAGGVVNEFGNTALKVAAAVAVVGVLYLGYRWLSGRKHSGSSALVPAGKTLDLSALKPVSGKVVA